VEVVSVNIMTSPRLLADLIASALADHELRRWVPGDSPALVSIVNDEPAAVESRVTIVLGDRLDDPLSVIIDGQRTTHAPTRPDRLHELVLELAQTVSSIPLQPGPDQA
jgi:hypothetical protein